jgi:serine/threonine protein kinase
VRVRPDLGSDQRELLARALGLPVGEAEAEAWAAQSHAEEPPGAETAPPVRRQLGEFELLSELGRGGMGVVYRAWQPSLGRQVALKSLLRSGDTKADARFRREIRALGQVEHPNLVKIFTSGADGERWFYAMELIEGAPLSAVCDRLQGQTTSATDVDLKTWQEALSTACEEVRRAEKPLTPDPSCSPLAHRGESGVRGEGAALPVASRTYVRHVIELLIQVAEAAHALHEKGVLHRDIKPGNILVTAEGTQAVLMDLGLAQLADDEEGRLTRTRQFVGTLRYASPQQVLAVGQLDRRSDVYSLGATLWELLTLRPLFGATEQMPTPELMERIQRDEPGRLRTSHPGIARDLEAIVVKCLEKDPGRRYATSQELASDLERYLDGQPVQARPIHDVERVWRWCKRHRTTAVLLLLLAGSVAMGIFSTALFAIRAQASAQEARMALRERDRALEQARRTAARLTGFLKDNPAILCLESNEILELFLAQAPDLTAADLRNALVGTESTAAGRETFALAAANMMGD